MSNRVMRPDAAAVFFVIIHHFLIPEHPEGLDRGKTSGEELPESFGCVFAHVPRIARQRHRRVGRRHDKTSARAQHAGRFRARNHRRAGCVRSPGTRSRSRNSLGKPAAAPRPPEFDVGQSSSSGAGTCLSTVTNRPGVGRHDLDAVTRFPCLFRVRRPQCVLPQRGRPAANVGKRNCRKPLPTPALQC